jgi:hypothetical protein
MVKQIHKKFTDDQVKLLLDLYTRGLITRSQALKQLECQKTRFYELLKAYRKNPERFTIAYARHKPQHRLPLRVDRVIREELEKDRQLIRHPKIPVWYYNYAAVRDSVIRRSSGDAPST